jgi:hypothetical protein
MLRIFLVFSSILATDGMGSCFGGALLVRIGEVKSGTEGALRNIDEEGKPKPDTEVAY